MLLFFLLVFVVPLALAFGISFIFPEWDEPYGKESRALFGLMLLNNRRYK